MKILSAEEIKLWDQFTIDHEPVLSIDLMERAAFRCYEWILLNFPEATSFSIFCGKGNNGGDGLAIARLLIENNISVTVYILEFGHKGTEDFQTNLERLHRLKAADIHFIQSEKNFHSFTSGDIIIDALFGSGLNRPIEGVTAQLIEHINQSGNQIISIDIPSGLFVDHSSVGNKIVKAAHTLSFQCLKPAFLVAENADWIGEVHMLDIGLLQTYYNSIKTIFETVELEVVRKIFKPRKRFAHKGDFGHAFLVAGSYGKIGAAVLAAKACLKSGAGLLTCHIPKCGYDIMQIAIPEVMVMTDFNSSINTKIDDDLTRYDVIGIGPGLGTASASIMLLRDIFDSFRNPLVLDADALNILGLHKDLLNLLPAGSILTPHPKEFARMFGESENDFQRIELALSKSKKHNCIIILKGHFTLIAIPDGIGFFNMNGNPGMATAGSGDVLTGIITGLLSQGYSAVEASLLGVYLHGLAGDKAAEFHTEQSMTASDIIENLGVAFKYMI